MALKTKDDQYVYVASTGHYDIQDIIGGPYNTGDVVPDECIKSKIQNKIHVQIYASKEAREANMEPLESKFLYVSSDVALNRQQCYDHLKTLNEFKGSKAS